MQNKDNQKKFEMKEWIGIFDNYITPEMCKEAIEFFERQNGFNKIYDRFSTERAGNRSKKDMATNIGPEEILGSHSQANFKTMFVNFDLALKMYLQNIDVGRDCDPLNYTEIKIQKTVPTGGYHIWHIEWGPGAGYEGFRRFLTYMIYLNDVNDGGETEFLHQSVRVKPKAGRIVIWPAAFPYMHRGNPPLKHEKYVITSWILSG